MYGAAGKAAGKPHTGSWLELCCSSLPGRKLLQVPPTGFVIATAAASAGEASTTSGSLASASAVADSTASAGDTLPLWPMSASAVADSTAGAASTLPIFIPTTVTPTIVPIITTTPTPTFLTTINPEAMPTNANTSPTSPAPTDGSANATGDGNCPEPQQALQAQNAARAARGTATLTWSPTLAAYAQRWADGCVFEHSHGPYGENLAYGSLSSCTQGVQLWVAEGSSWVPDMGFTESTGHFTQVSAKQADDPSNYIPSPYTTIYAPSI